MSNSDVGCLGQRLPRRLYVPKRQRQLVQQWLESYEKGMVSWPPPTYIQDIINLEAGFKRQREAIRVKQRIKWLHEIGIPDVRPLGSRQPGSRQLAWVKTSPKG